MSQRALTLGVIPQNSIRACNIFQSNEEEEDKKEKEHQDAVEKIQMQTAIQSPKVKIEKKEEEPDVNPIVEKIIK